MNKEIHKKYCPRCGATDDLTSYTHRPNRDGIEVYYYICNTCNAKRRRKWYHSGHQEQAQINNARYRKNRAV